MKKDLLNFKKGRWLLLMFFSLMLGGNDVWAQTSVTEGFDSWNSLPSEWSLAGGATLGFSDVSNTTFIVDDSYPNGNGKSLWANVNNGSTGTTYIVTPKIQKGNISFYFRKKGTSGSTKGYIRIYEYDNNSVGETQLWGCWPNGSNEATSKYTQGNLTLSKDTRLAIYISNACIDDFTYIPYVDAGAIAKPTDFAVTGTTYESASFSWTAGGTETAWKLAYKANADFDPTDENSGATVKDVDQNPFVLSELEENTTYYAYLRAVSGEQLSSWTSKVTFTTPAQYPAPTGFAAGAYTATTQTFSWTAGSTETAWQIAYSTDANFDPASATPVDVTVNPYILEGLTAETTYYACLRANYGSGYSAWTEKISFTPSNTMNTLINDGSNTNDYVPVYGYYTDNLTWSQMIIPSASISSVVGRQIEKLTFHASQASVSWGNAKFDVYIGETSNIVFSSTTADWSNLTKVYSGSLSISGNKMEVVFEDGYVYDGDNLIIGFNQTVTGSYVTSTWYGVNGSTNTTIQGYGTGNKNYRKFLPKMTITSVPYEAPSVAKPKALTVSEIKETSVKLSWTDGEAGLTAWEIKYSTDENFDPATEGSSVEANANPHTLTSLTAETTYYAYVRAKKGTDYSDWSNMVTFVPTKFASITVNDGTYTSGYGNVPFYGYYANKAETAGQYIIPKANLSAADKGDISKLTLYSLSDNTNWGSAEFKVYLGEVDNTTFTSSGTTLVDWANMQEVYEGPLSVVNGLMDITFDNSYEYNGNNLIIGFLLTTTGTSRTVNWYGSQVNYAAAYSYYNYNNVYSTYSNNFSPKTTITYLPLTGAKMKVSTDAIDFGKITPASSDTDKQKTFTISNTGIADLTNISVSYSDEYATAAFSLNDNIATSIAQNGEDITVTVTMDAATAGNYTGTITINADDQTEKIITVTGEYASNPATMAVTLDNTDVPAIVDFGTVNKQVVKTFTITNDGDLPLNITSIESSNTTDFTVSPATLTVAGGTSETFTVTFLYDENALDVEKTANITITPENLSAISFGVKGTRIEMWSEDFSGNALPAGWESDGSSYWTFSNGVAQGVYDNSNNMTKALTTPALVVNGTNDVLTFKYKRNNAKMTIKKIKDNGEPEVLHTDASFNTDSEWQTYTITGLEAGTYKFQFMNEDYQLDDFEGFKLYVPAAHEVEIKYSNIPASGNQYVEYTASVNVKVTGSSNEELTAKFFIGDTQYGSEVVKTVNSGNTETFEVSFIPESAISGEAYFTITNNDINIETSKVTVNIAAATVINEAEENTFTADENLASIDLRYTKAASKWGTITLPFNITVSELSTAFGTTLKVMGYESSTESSMKFKTVVENDQMVGGYAYVIYSDEAINGAKFFNKTVSRATAQYDGSTTKFQATYAPITTTSANRPTTWWGITPDGNIMKAGASATLPAMRGYIVPSSSNARITIFLEDTTTGITTVMSVDDFEHKGFYNLSGQKVEKAQKGLYIMDGKKVVRK